VNSTSCAFPGLRTAVRPWLVAVCLVGLLAAGCDDTPGTQAIDPEPPELAGFSFSPKRVVVDDVPPDRIQDDRVQVPLTVEARASDPDGSVDRVELALEPSQNPQGTLLLDLPAADGDRFAGAINIGLPLVDEIYTVRVYAVDNDSLVSNQVRGQLRVVAPTDTTSQARAAE